MKNLKPENIQKLSDVELSIYRCIMTNSDKVIYMRVRDLAEASHTSSTSVMRFIKKMGFESFTEFKYYLKNEMKNTAAKQNDIERHFDILNKKNFNRDLEETVQLVADKIIKAESVCVVGMGASGAIGNYASRKLANLDINSFSIVDTTYPVASRLSKKGLNVFIVLSTSGETQELVEMLNYYYKKKNDEIVVITSNRSSRLAKMADILLDYDGDNERAQIYYDLSSQIPCVFILELIINRIRCVK